jgi:hypothetical protein
MIMTDSAGWCSENFKAKVKVNVKLFLYLTEHHAIKAYWGVDV